MNRYATKWSAARSRTVAVGVKVDTRCAMGLLRGRCVQLRLEKAQKVRTPIGALVAQLKRIRLGVVSVDEGKAVRAKLERMGPEEQRIVKALGLAALVPK